MVPAEKQGLFFSASPGPWVPDRVVPRQGKEVGVLFAACCQGSGLGGVIH